MNSVKTIAFSALITLGLGTAQAASCGSAAPHSHSKEAVVKSVPMDIVDTAASAGSFSTLLAAAKAAGLVDTLKSE